MDATSCDVVIVGGGAAGLSAALVLGRARRRVVVVDAGSPRNAPAAHMQGYLSRDGMPPAELLAVGRREAAVYGVEIVDDVVVGIGTGFTAHLDRGGTLTARRVLVTTGLVDAGSIAHAQLVRQWSDDVVYFAHTQAPTAAEAAALAARGIRVVDGEITRLVVDDDRLTGVELVDGTLVPRDAVFVRPIMRPRPDSLLANIGCDVDGAGFPVADRTGRTTAPGIWVAGNAADPRAQVITAAGAGSAAAIAINADLIEDDIASASRDAALT